MKRPIILALVLAAVAATAACSEPPYVRDPARIDRDHPDFGKTMTDREAVEICYNTRGASPADVAALARDACGEFGKVAVFEEQDYTVCPLTNPVAAVYRCEAPSASTWNSQY